MENQQSKVGLYILVIIIFLMFTSIRDVYPQAARVPDMKVYALSGGQLHFKNMGIFYDTGEHEGEVGYMVVPCYLIKHGNDWLLWDTGNGDEIAAHPAGIYKIGIRFIVQKTLVSQLAELGLKPSDIKYVAVSHLHPDHSGNIKLFPKSTFFISGKEIDWAFSKPTPSSVQLSLLAPLKSATVVRLEADSDIFNDGSVRIIRTPGHTPGHQSLMLKLPQSGNVLITGDLYHTKEGYNKKQVDAGNYSRAEELASFDRFDKLLINVKGRLIIQHSPEDFAAFPAFPKFIE